MTTAPGIFVVGTDTGVGKTRVAASLIRGLRGEGRRVGAIKPVATGGERLGDAWIWGDAEILIAALGGGIARERVCPIVFEEPLAPPVAARRAGRLLGRDEVFGATFDALAWWSERAEAIVIEGVGGLLCPLAEGCTVVDLAVALDYPLLIVGRRALGTLNHTLLTVEAAARRGLRIAGVVLNGAEPTIDPVVESTNSDELARRLDGVGVWPSIAHGSDLLEACRFSASGDAWYSRLCTPRNRVESSASAEGPHR
ncbi:MAG: dethiobiotin synthase [Isosphaeraceae bacterium]|nr:dethiobiotin synthase [Isosphaeraceae bacterium]